MQKISRPWSLWCLSSLSGILLALSWPVDGFTPLIFFALVPLLLVEDIIFQTQSKQKVFLHAYLTFLIWNVLTTYWVWNSTPAAILAFTVNALLMATTFWFYHFSCKQLFSKEKPSSRYRGALLIVYWIGFEMFHQNWDISWPWLTLGNIFSETPSWVQWYEITGTFGGSLWILLSNLCMLAWVKSMIARDSRKRKTTRAFILFAVVFVPIMGSLIRYSTYKEKGETCEVVVVQPNIDPYHEQYEIGPVAAVEKMLDLAYLKTDSNTHFIVTPESMIQEYSFEENLNQLKSVQKIREFLKDFPHTQLIAGISTFTWTTDSNTPGARKYIYASSAPANRQFYLCHNTVIVLDSNPLHPIPCYHKSKLTPAVEIMPFATWFPFIEKLAINLGGTVGSLGIDKERKVFTHPGIGNGKPIRYSDIICYESIYGGFTSRFVKNGAEILFISTNDGWWGNTPGHRQHASYARLRAIENRRSIARSANTGISCFINQKGDDSKATPYWKESVIKASLTTNQRLTFYSRYGDLLGRISLLCSGLFFCLSFVYKFMKRRKSPIQD